MLKFVLRTCLCLILFVIFESTGVIRPPDEIVRSNGGGMAQLHCPLSTTHQSLARVTWTKDDEKLVEVTDCTSNDITDCQLDRTVMRYTMDGSLVSGVTLGIDDVVLADDGIYQCKAILMDGLIERSIQLAVTYEPQDIRIEDVNKDIEVANMDVVYAVIGRPYLLNCTVPSPCNPPANISWSLNDVDATNFEQANHTSAESAPLMTSSKVVELTAETEDTGKTISCTAMHYGLAQPLQMNVTLDVGNLPDSPSGVEDRVSTVNVDSFIVAWLQGSSGGKPQTFTVTYCEVLDPDVCSEISGIGQTRTRIENLRPFTLYRVSIKSHTVYGFSEQNMNIDKSTRPLSPKELGVEGVLNSQNGRIDVIRPNNISGPLPQGLCFQLVDLTFDPSADTSGAVSQDCVHVGQYLGIPRGQSWKTMALVAYGNSVYSASSALTGVDTGLSLGIIIGASVGGGVLFIIIFIILYIKTKGRSSSKAVANRRLPAQPDYRRQPQGRGDIDGMGGNAPPTYSGVKYQEVNDVPATPGPAGDLYATHHSYHYTTQQDHDPDLPKASGGNGQYYSRNITMDKKKAADESNDRYAYMDPLQ